MSDIGFVDAKVKKAYLDLEHGRGDEKQLFTFITRAIHDIEKNHIVGDNIPKRLIPKYYAKHNLDNLWRYELPNGWRLLYTVLGNKVRIVSIIVEWLDHTNYERRFGY